MHITPLCIASRNPTWLFMIHPRIFMNVPLSVAFVITSATMFCVVTRKGPFVDAREMITDRVSSVVSFGTCIEQCPLPFVVGFSRRPIEGDEVEHSNLMSTEGCDDEDMAS